MARRRGRRLAIAGALAVLAAGVVLVLVSARPTVLPIGDAPAGKVQPPSAALAAPPQATVPPPSAPSRPARAAAARPTEPVIDEVRVEKSEVCEGEENLVTVRAHAPDGSDAFLHYAVGGEAGSEVPVRAFLTADGGQPERARVAVFGRNGAATFAEVPEYRVKTCAVDRYVAISARTLPNTVDELELTARLMERADASPPFRALRYQWSFGDGDETETTDPTVVHDYGGRHQRAAYSQVLVRVTVTGESGEPVMGRLALQLANRAFDARQQGFVTILSRPAPRFPKVEADGKVRQGFLLWHDEEDAVTITRVTARAHVVGPGPAAIPQVGEPAEVEPRRLLRSVEIPPGVRTREEITIDFARERDLYAVSYRIEGRSADGLPAVGELTVLRPPPKPTRDTSVPLTDAAETARVRRALEILGTEVVTDEDLRRLEREGRIPPR